MAEIDKSLPNEVRKTIEIPGPRNRQSRISGSLSRDSRSRDHGNHTIRRWWSRNRF
jgi:hypothetical protein